MAISQSIPNYSVLFRDPSAGPDNMSFDLTEKFLHSSVWLCSPPISAPAISSAVPGVAVWVLPGLIIRVTQSKRHFSLNPILLLPLSPSPSWHFVDKGPSTPWFAAFEHEMGRNPLSVNIMIMQIMLMHHYALHNFNGLHFYYFDFSFSMSYVSLLWNNLFIFFNFCQYWVNLDTSTVFQPLGV